MTYLPADAARAVSALEVTNSSWEYGHAMRDLLALFVGEADMQAILASNAPGGLKQWAMLKLGAVA